MEAGLCKYLFTEIIEPSQKVESKKVLVVGARIGIQEELYERCYSFYVLH